MPPSKIQLIRELESIASTEFAAIDSHLAGLDFDKNLLVMEVVRFIDRMSVDNWLVGPPDDFDDHFANLLALYGFAPTLGVLLPKVPMPTSLTMSA